LALLYGTTHWYGEFTPIQLLVTFSFVKAYFFMILKLSKWFIMALFGATVCSAAYLVPWYENDMDVDEAWGNANANTVCTVSSSVTTC
jgi:hypothetical protein